MIVTGGSDRNWYSHVPEIARLCRRFSHNVPKPGHLLSSDSVRVQDWGMKPELTTAGNSESD